MHLARYVCTAHWHILDEGKRSSFVRVENELIKLELCRAGILRNSIIEIRSTDWNKTNSNCFHVRSSDIFVFYTKATIYSPSAISVIIFLNIPVQILHPGPVEQLK